MTRTASRSARSRSLARGLSALAVIGTINLGAPIAAQAPSGVVTGTVTDPVGDVVPGVTITLSGRSLNRPLTVVTTSDGSFRLAGVPDGSFTLTAEYSAFKKITRRISVARGERVELPTIKMGLGGAAKPNVKELDLKPSEIVALRQGTRMRSSNASMRFCTTAETSRCFCLAMAGAETRLTASSSSSGRRIRSSPSASC